MKPGESGSKSWDSSIYNTLHPSRPDKGRLNIYEGAEGSYMEGASPSRCCPCRAPASLRPRPHQSASPDSRQGGTAHARRSCHCHPRPNVYMHEHTGTLYCDISNEYKAWHAPGNTGHARLVIIQDAEEATVTSCVLTCSRNTFSALCLCCSSLFFICNISRILMTILILLAIETTHLAAIQGA